LQGLHGELGLDLEALGGQREVVKDSVMNRPEAGLGISNVSSKDVINECVEEAIARAVFF
jgi:hypothetical protein